MEAPWHNLPSSSSTKRILVFDSAADTMESHENFCWIGRWQSGLWVAADTNHIKVHAYATGAQEMKLVNRRDKSFCQTSIECSDPHSKAFEFSITDKKTWAVSAAINLTRIFLHILGHIQYSVTIKLRRPVTYYLRAIRILFNRQKVGADGKIRSSKLKSNNIVGKWIALYYGQCFECKSSKRSISILMTLSGICNWVFITCRPIRPL